ncbi:Guanine nucleotide exchange factor lte1 [Coniothyrium glycines]
MALSALQHDASPADPGSPADGHRDLLPAADSTRRRADDPRSLRRVKDSREHLKTRTRARGASSGTVDTGSTSSTTGGRAYTVANVHNGVIYLRPTVRPGNQRSRPQPDPFVFPPQTPPDSATLDSLRPLSNEWEQSVYGPRTPRSEPTPPPLLPPDLRAENAARAHSPLPPAAGPRPLAHVRSHSFSTVDDHTVTTLSNEPGTFKVVIERPPFGRPKTADTSSFPLLQVPIPNYRLGTPRFSTRGTVDFRSSIYTRASGPEEFANSLRSPQQAGTSSFLSSRPRSEAYSPIPHRFRATMDRPPLPTSAPSTARVSHIPIGPGLYDTLTLNPDDQAVVRFSPTGEILAATPSRLVAHITSPSFLDYELLSDFFLTFRDFLCTRDLVAYLISRLRWAVDRQDDFGRIVRVRTFVALRHWILNYFDDDFVPVYNLRLYFCELVNSLYSDLKNRADGGGGDIKIVGELKKCWRRTCTSHWDMGDVLGQNYADIELAPGGQPDPQASIKEVEESPPLPSTPQRATVRDTKETSASNPSDQFASRHMEWAQRARHTPQNSLSSPHVPSHDYDNVQVPLSPASEQSVHVLSCSIPMRGLTRVEQGVDLPLYPHPVPASNARIAASPQQPISTKRNNRPAHSHKRSGSFSDALRDSRAPLSLPRDAYADHAISALTNIPGSLVKGGLVQPGSPYFEAKTLRHTQSQRHLENDDASEDGSPRSGHATNPGMKKILGTVRRALSTRQALNSSPQIGTLAQQRRPPSTHSSIVGNSSTVSTGAKKRRPPRPRLQTRVDLLAAAALESFREALQQQIDRDSQERHSNEPPSLGGFEFEFEGRNTQSPEHQQTPRPSPDPRVYSNITSGSKSILIIDDTGAPPLPSIPNASSPDIANPQTSDAVTLEPERSTLVDERVVAANASLVQAILLHDEEQGEGSNSQRWSSRTRTKGPAARQRRSMSEGREQMHSFRRRGSTKKSIARSGSLRRHASFNSGLSRRRGPDSVATFQTFQTMSSDNDPFQFDRQPVAAAAGPTRQLRRRPGGDLRAVDHVQDLEIMQRPHSTGSVSNRTHSITNSVILRSDRFVEPAKQESGQTESPEDEEPPQKPISLMETHSSQPNLRPSFEVEVAKLAALPDDTDDEGGVESALMKLEGRYEKKSPSIPSNRVTQDMEFYQPTGARVHNSQPAALEQANHGEDDDVFHHPLVTPNSVTPPTQQVSNEDFSKRVHGTSSVGESTDSYSLIPLLDRGDIDFTNGRDRAATLETMRSSAKPSPLQLATLHIDQPTTPTSSANSSIEYIVETESMKRIPTGATVPVPSSVVRESFLLDEDEDLSDDTSTMGARSDRMSHGVRSFFDDQPPTPEEDLPTHPLRHPPTPPLTANHLRSPVHDSTTFERGLPTPGLTPTVSRANPQARTTSNPVLEPMTVHSPSLEALRTSNTHLPFILAYDSEVLAQQFTIVEKDALDEIDWKELIELRWKQSSPQIRDWVHYLRMEEARGVDVVIARFNLVVKWVVSECVLTEDLEERARCITKYIHIAQHARRLRNYATMYQISIALISNDVSKLKKTWALVPAAELLIMKELEALVQPLKNFHNLRLEMETTSVEEGCIPFIGIYTRDLIYNAQKPPFIDAPPVDGERLVNFDRHHTAATIVKNLLRLLEASSKYAFKAEPHIVGKCLWLAALSDDDIIKYGRRCE